MAERGIAVSGSDAHESGLLDVPARARDQMLRRSRRRPGRPGRHGGGLHGRAARQSRGPSGGARRAPAVAAGGRRAVLAARAPRRRRDGHPRQDHHHVDAGHGTSRLRRRPVVRDRLDVERVRAQRGCRTRRGLRRRGRRERRGDPRVHAVRRGRHERRRRPSRLLRHSGGIRARVRRLPVAGSTEQASVVCGVDDAGRSAARHPEPRARAADGDGRARVLRRCLRAVDIEPVAGGSTVEVVRGTAAPRPRSTLQVPGPAYVVDALAALAAGLELGYPFADLDPRARRLPRARPGGWSSRARPPGCGSTTATPTIPSRSPVTCEAARELAGGGRLLVVLPAAPVQPDPGFRRRDGAGARRGGPRRRDGCLPGARDAGGRGHRRAGRRGGAPCRRPTWPTSRTGRRSANRLVAMSRSGDLVLTLGAGDVTDDRPAGAEWTGTRERSRNDAAQGRQRPPGR